MKRPSKRSTLLLGGIVILAAGIAATSIGLTHSNKGADTPATKRPAATTTSIATVVHNPKNYDNKELSLTGTITLLGASGSQNYYLVTTSKGTSSALRLDFSKSAGYTPSSYVSPAAPKPSQELHTKGTYTVTGRLVNTSGKLQPVFVVSSVK